MHVETTEDGSVVILPQDEYYQTLSWLFDIWNGTRAAAPQARAVALKVNLDENCGVLFKPDALAKVGTKVKVLNNIPSLDNLNREQFCTLITVLPDDAYRVVIAVVDELEMLGPVSIYRCNRTKRFYYFVVGHRSLGLTLVPAEDM